MLRPERFDVPTNTAGCEKAYRHWKKTFVNYMDVVCAAIEDANVVAKQKLYALTNSVSATIYEYFADKTTYDTAIVVLDNMYCKPENIIYNRHKLLTSTQSSDQTIDLYIQELERKARDCNFRAVTADQNRQDYIRDAFISGIKSASIRVRLLEKPDLNLDDAYQLARSLELAQKQSQTYGTSDSINNINHGNGESAHHNNAIQCTTGESTHQETTMHPSPMAPSQSVNCAKCETNWVAAIPKRRYPTPSNNGQSCFFCGKERHIRSKCPALNTECGKCKKVGHWAIVCRSSPTRNSNRPNVSNINPSFSDNSSQYGFNSPNSFGALATIPQDYGHHNNYDISDYNEFPLLASIQKPNTWGESDHSYSYFNNSLNSIQSGSGINFYPNSKNISSTGESTHQN